MNFLVETSRANGSRIQRTFMISGPDNHYITILLEAIHFCEDLIESRSTWASLTAWATRSRE